MNKLRNIEILFVFYLVVVVGLRFYSEIGFRFYIFLYLVVSEGIWLEKNNYV